MIARYALNPAASLNPSSGTMNIALAIFRLPLALSQPTKKISENLFATDMNDAAFLGFSEYAIRDWDGDGAEPITSETLDFARRVHSALPRALRPADIAPGGDGTIGFEWQEGPAERRKFTIIKVGPDDRVAARKLNEYGQI